MNHEWKIVDKSEYIKKYLCCSWVHHEPGDTYELCNNCGLHKIINKYNIVIYRCILEKYVAEFDLENQITCNELLMRQILK